MTRKGAFWPWFIVGILSLDVVIAATLIWISVGDPSFAVEEDYYERAVAWDDEVAQRNRNEELGWSAECFFSPAEPGVVRTVLADASGSLIRDAAVTIECFHNARAADRFRFDMTPQEDGTYTAEFNGRRPGLWEFRITVETRDERFTTIQTITLTSTPAG